MRKLFAILVFAASAFFPGSSTPGSNGLTITKGNNGELLATMHTEGALLSMESVFDSPPNCQFTPQGPAKPCFRFAAVVNGTEAVPTTGCVIEQGGGFTICSVEGVKSVKLVLENGGLVNVNGGTGHHGLGCSPFPVTIEAHGGSSGAFSVGVWDGCTETVSCLDGFGGVDADASDDVKPNCAYVTRHGSR